MALSDTTYFRYRRTDARFTTNRAGLNVGTNARKTDGTFTASVRAVAADMRIDDQNSNNWTDTVGLRIFNSRIHDEAGSAGTITGAADIYLENATKAGGVTITNRYGIHMENFDLGGTNVGIDMGSNTLENVGASGNDWKANTLSLSNNNESGAVALTVENTNNNATTSSARISIKVGANVTKDADLQFDFEGLPPSPRAWTVATTIS